MPLHGRGDDLLVAGLQALIKLRHRGGLLLAAFGASGDQAALNCGSAICTIWRAPLRSTFLGRIHPKIAGGGTMKPPWSLGGLAAVVAAASTYTQSSNGRSGAAELHAELRRVMAARLASFKDLTIAPCSLRIANRALLDALARDQLCRRAAVEPTTAPS